MKIFFASCGVFCKTQFIVNEVKLKVCFKQIAQLHVTTKICVQQPGWRCMQMMHHTSLLKRKVQEKLIMHKEQLI